MSVTHTSAHGVAALHVAGADAVAQGCRLLDRHLGARRGPVRASHRNGTLRRRDVRRDRGQGGHLAAAADGRLSSRCSGGSRGGDSQVPSTQSHRPSSQRGRARRGPLAVRAEARPRLGRAHLRYPSRGRAVERERRRAAAAPGGHRNAAAPLGDHRPGRGDDGACGACVNGTTQCSFNGVETCAAGAWGSAVACPASAPVAAEGSAGNRRVAR